MSNLHEMINLGIITEEKLVAAGIMNQADLINLGSKEAFLLVRDSIDPEACLHLLYALEAAILGVEKKLLIV